MKYLSLAISIALTILIFTMSLMSGEVSSGLSSGLSVSVKQFLDSIFVNNQIELATLHIFIRKSAHVFEYFVLGISYFFTAKSFNLSILRILLIGLVTATADELLQNIPADRTASALDILVFDFGGFILGFGLFILLLNQTKTYETKEALALLQENKISTNKAYKYIYNKDHQLRFTNKAHFVKLRIIVPGEKGVNTFLKILFFIPFPIFIARFALQFVKFDDKDIPISKNEMLSLINNKGIKIQVNASTKEKVYIKTI